LRQLLELWCSCKWFALLFTLAGPGHSIGIWWCIYPRYDATSPLKSMPIAAITFLSNYRQEKKATQRKLSYNNLDFLLRFFCSLFPLFSKYTYDWESWFVLTYLNGYTFICDRVNNVCDIDIFHALLHLKSSNNINKHPNQIFKNPCFSHNCSSHFKITVLFIPLLSPTTSIINNILLLITSILEIHI